MSCKFKYFVVKGNESGLAMDVEGGDTNPGAKVILWNETGNDNQLFYECRCTNTIRSKINDCCITVEGDDLVLMPYEPSNAEQRWRIVEDRIQNTEKEDWVLDVADHNTDPGARICAWNFKNTDNQLWTFEVQEEQEYPMKTVFLQLSSRLNGMVLDVEGANTASGTRVVTYYRKPWGNENQLFYVHPCSGTIRSILNDYCLDIDDGVLVVNQFDPDRSTQFWRLEGNEKICRVDDENQVLDVADFNTDPGARICQWDDNAGDNQRWDVHLMPMDKASFFIRSKMNDLVLDIEGGDPSPGANVITWHEKVHFYYNQLFYQDLCTGTIRTKLNDFCLDVEDDGIVVNPYVPGKESQQWFVAGETIENSVTGSALDILDNNRDPGAKIGAWSFHGGENQSWDIDFVCEGYPDYDGPSQRPHQDKYDDEGSDSDCSGDDEDHTWRRQQKARRRRLREEGKSGRRIIWKRKE